MPSLDILLPTYNRAESLVMTLAGIAGQSYACYRLIVADQSDRPAIDQPVVHAMVRMLEAHCGTVDWHHRPEELGIAEQRHFLLQQATGEYVLYIDDDVWMEPWVVKKLVETMETEQCGFVGAFPAGLSYVDDIRLDQQRVEYWNGPIQPEAIHPDTPEWERYHLHRAANIYHAAMYLKPGEVRTYKVAWSAQCCLYDRKKLTEVGGFSFWDRLPRFHSGEEVLVQNLLMRRWGGCGIIPSGTFSSELPSTVLNDRGTIDGHALELLDEMIERFSPESNPT